MGKRVMKRILVCAIAILAVLAGCIYTDINVSAAAVQTGYLVEQAKGEAPNVKVYMTGDQNEQRCRDRRNDR